MTYFKAIDSRKVIEIGDFTYKFEPAYRNAATGGSWGILAVEDEKAGSALAKVAQQYGVYVINESEYVQALQKKSSLNINLVRHNPPAPQNVGRVEAKKAGETSSKPSAESFDDLMAGPKPDPETSANLSQEDPVISDKTEAPEPAPANVDSEPEAEAPAPTPKQPAKKKAAKKSTRKS